ncbi:glycosyltransferase [Fibrobacter succinogenes]|uniref:Glycosyl transferase family 2 n=1 Tax=Fibrobacter succinogenes TaxID=833 RepID=A0A380RTA7_FIBSU|nr:glycosyltransferase [Fibrobacter succinogenes]PWJ36554.1 glycosyl transferase family 2 [Fibrobacter succinogenes subsp. elongatus]SUQ18803.1 Glycosyl transferase family 2 [Fibrobacter succinogenes]
MKICITLATYNGEKYLAQMLDSLVAQTRPADVIIAVDDGSKDSTCEILERYKDKLPLEITKFEKNRGHRASFSTALEKASKLLADDDLIFLADQDDIWLPNKLEVMSQKIGDSSMTFGDAEIIDGDGVVTESSWRKKACIVEHLSQQALLTGYTNVTGCMVAFKARLLKTVLPIPQDVPVHDQWITLCATAENGYRAIADKVIQYRIHGNNAIGEGNKTWSEKLQTNLQWAKAVKGSNLFEKMPDESCRFLDKFIQFLELRFSHAFLSPLWFPWILKNARNIYPQVHSASKMIARILFSFVGVSTAKKFFNKK